MKKTKSSKKIVLKITMSMTPSHTAIAQPHYIASLYSPQTAFPQPPQSQHQAQYLPTVLPFSLSPLIHSLIDPSIPNHQKGAGTPFL